MTEVTDDNGRKLTLRELDPADMLDAIEAAGNAADNTTWVRLAMMMMAVDSIGGVPIPPPQNKREIRALAKQIGNVGMRAIQGVMFPSSSETGADDAAPKQMTTTDVAKN
jgi:hypothetical protein